MIPEKFFFLTVKIEVLQACYLRSQRAKTKAALTCAGRCHPGGDEGKLLSWRSL